MLFINEQFYLRQC